MWPFSWNAGSKNDADDVVVVNCRDIAGNIMIKL